MGLFKIKHRRYVARDRRGATADVGARQPGCWPPPSSRFDTGAWSVGFASCRPLVSLLLRVSVDAFSCPLPCRLILNVVRSYTDALGTVVGADYVGAGVHGRYGTRLTGCCSFEKWRTMKNEQIPPVLPSPTNPDRYTFAKGLTIAPHVLWPLYPELPRTCRGSLALLRT